jgi:transcriptional regulator with XRE-family HTH domain
LTFGSLLRRQRLAAGLSQELLAERARMSTNGIGALERGDRRTTNS